MVKRRANVELFCHTTIGRRRFTNANAVDFCCSHDRNDHLSLFESYKLVAASGPPPFEFLPMLYLRPASIFIATGEALRFKTNNRWGGHRASFFLPIKFLH